MSLEEILNLSAAEKILLVEKIWDSIPTSAIEVTPSQQQELDRRLQKHKNGETEYFTWEEIKQRIHS